MRASPLPGLLACAVLASLLAPPAAADDHPRLTIAPDEGSCQPYDETGWSGPRPQVYRGSDGHLTVYVPTRNDHGDWDGMAIPVGCINLYIRCSRALVDDPDPVAYARCIEDGLLPGEATACLATTSEEAAFCQLERAAHVDGLREAYERAKASALAAADAALAAAQGEAAAGLDAVNGHYDGLALLLDQLVQILAERINELTGKAWDVLDPALDDAPVWPASAAITSNVEAVEGCCYEGPPGLRVGPITIVPG